MSTLPKCRHYQNVANQNVDTTKMLTLKRSTLPQCRKSKVDNQHVDTQHVDNTRTSGDNYLFEYLRQSLVICRNNCAIVVFEVLVNNGAALANAQAAEAVTSGSFPASGFVPGSSHGFVFVGSLKNKNEKNIKISFEKKIKKI